MEEEKLIQILNLNGYNLTEETTMDELIRIINTHYTVIAMIESTNIFIPTRRKVRYLF